jgi:hypothetical protein
MSSATDRISVERAGRVPAVGWLAAAVMVAAPALIVAGNGLHPVVDGQSASALLDVVAAGPARWLIAKLTYAAGSLLLIVALASVVRLRPGGVVLVGSVLAGIGTGCNALSQALFGYTAYAAVRVPVDRSAAAALLDGFDGLGPAALPVSFVSVPVMVLGLLVVGVGLLVTRAVPRVTAVVLLVGVVAGALVQAGPLSLLAGAPLVAAFVLLARSRLDVDRVPATRP